MPDKKPCILLMHNGLGDESSQRQRLAVAGWQVIEAVDAIEAFSTVKRHEVDLALLRMPVDDMADMDLPRVLRKVSTFSYLPVIILASSPAEEQKCRFLDSGADDVISDNVSAEEMTARIRVLLRIKQLNDDLSDSRKELEEALARERELLVALRHDNEQLHLLATTDALTHVQNVRSFQDILRHEFNIAKRYNQPLSLMMLDVDHFKVVNDTHGHPSGDYVLKELAVILKQAVRDSDVIARTGGEEFSILLPKAGPQQAMKFAERIRQHVYSRKFVVYGQTIHVTSSIGMACFPNDAEIVEAKMLVYFADQALLIAKESGRDCVLAVRDMDRAVRQRLRRQYIAAPQASSDTELIAADVSGVLK